MFVSGFWAILLLCTQIEKYNRSRLVLSLFMVVSALMFYAHCVFFNEMHSEIPVSDTFYSFGVLASYPLFYIFLVSLTSTSQHLRRSWLLLLPAVFLSVTVGVMYALMSATRPPSLSPDASTMSNSSTSPALSTTWPLPTW